MKNINQVLQNLEVGFSEEDYVLLKIGTSLFWEEKLTKVSDKAARQVPL
jgi:hypothetical protein